MNYLLVDKHERRRILDQIKHWNFGIAPNGNLAQESSFVHNAVPDIFRQVSDDSDPNFTAISYHLPTITRSEWTENLVRSGVSNPDDETTVKSLAICSSVFRNDIEFARLKSKKTSNTHELKVSINAYVRLDNIARLTTGFENELAQAQEHWPQNPQVAWNKLCQIWNKYGFLWPERLHLGCIEDLIKSVKSRNKKSQDQVQHLSQKNDTIVWRTTLRPIYDFFPETLADKKTFIVDIIRQVSSLIVFNGSLFKLKNMETNQYLGRHQQQSSAGGVDNAVVMITNKDTEHSVWKFRNTGSADYFVVSGADLFLCSDHEGLFLTKEGGSTSDLNGAVKLDQQQPSDSWRIREARYVYRNIIRNCGYPLDDVIASVICLKDGDSVILNQNFYHLRSCMNYFPPFSSFSNCNSLVHNSIDGQYNFSSTEQSESNITHPTCNSLSNLEYDKNSANKISRSRNSSQTSGFNNADVYIEKLEDVETRLIPYDFRWIIELATKNNNSESVRKTAQHQSTLKHSPLTDMTHNNPAPANENHNSTTSDAVYNVNQNVTVPSLSSTSESQQIFNGTSITPAPFFDKAQKSQWLDGNTKLYKLPIISNESDESIVITNIDLSMDSTKRDSALPKVYLKPILSNEDDASPLVFSAKQIGKLPVKSTQARQLQRQCQNNPPSISNGDSDRTTSSAPSLSQSLTPTPKRLKEIKDATLASKETEAEAIANLYKNLFARSTPSSNTTSCIRYYDDVYDQPSDQVRSCTATPRSRYSQIRPTSSVNLTPEDYQVRRRSRETSFMLLVRQETKQRLWVRALKQSTLCHWVQSITSNTKKRYQTNNKIQ